MNILSDMKTTGLLAFLRVDGGRELDLDFKAKSFSIPITVTLDGHVVKAFLSLVPAEKVVAGGPNMELVITRERVVMDDASPVAESKAAEKTEVSLTPPAPVVEVKADVKTEAPPAPVVEVKADSKPAAKAEDKKQK